MPDVGPTVVDTGCGRHRCGRQRHRGRGVRQEGREGHLHAVQAQGRPTQLLPADLDGAVHVARRRGLPERVPERPGDQAQGLPPAARRGLPLPPRGADGLPWWSRAVTHLRRLLFEDLGFANVDHHRAIRCGFPEVIYCEGKQVDQVVKISERRLADGGNLRDAAPRRNSPRPCSSALRRRPTTCWPAPSPSASSPRPLRTVSVGTACAGTSDMFVAEG